METTNNGLKDRLDRLHDTLIDDFGFDPEKEEHMTIFDFLGEISILANAQLNVIKMLTEMLETSLDEEQLIDLFDKTRYYYESMQRFDYSPGLEKAKHLILNHTKINFNNKSE